MSSALIVISFFLIFYAYFGYGLLLALILSRREELEDICSEELLPRSVTVIITARNEEQVMREKLANTLEAAEWAVREGLQVEVIVASDCSTDGTNNIVEAFSDRGVVLLNLPSGKGKESAQAEAVKHARGEVIVFTDAKTLFEPAAIYEFAKCFSYPGVGAVSSTDVITGGESGEGMYVKYEMWLRELESEFNTLVGLSGSGFAVKREVCVGMRTDIQSDFGLLLRARELGFRGISSPHVRCFYRAVGTAEEEFPRKVRTVVRGMTTLWACRSALNPFKDSAFAFQLWSHKVLRWAVPLLFLFALLGSLLLAKYSEFFALLALLQVLTLYTAYLGYTHESLRAYRAVRIPLFLVMSNAAILKAWWDFLRGYRVLTWTPSQR